MRRYDYSESRCDDARCGELVRSWDGDWVEADDAERAAADAVRQTQRRMIAALYWRAGVLSAGGYLVPAVHIISMAQDMEAACAR